MAASLNRSRPVSVTKDSAKPRWGQERRLAFIDLRLQYEGRINRRDLQGFFEISTPQASADLELYRQSAPENLHYDASQRVYVAGAQFIPVTGRSSATSYLDELYRLARGVVAPEESFVGFVPPTGVVATPARAIGAQEVSTLVRAIRDRVVLRVLYQSMSSNEPVIRVIAPLALGFDGLRWHVRAWCYQRQAFRDFAMGRLTVTGEEPAAEPINPGDDAGWTTMADIILVPHPALSPTQRAAVMADYAMTDGRLHLPCRKAMLFYTLRHLNLQSPDILDDPSIQHVIVENRADVERWMREDRALSKDT